MKIDWMLVVLSIGGLLVIVSAWRAHRSQSVSFSLLDLVMENGKVSRIAFAFMIVLGVCVWVFIDLEIKGKMTEGYFTIFLAGWVTPVIAKMFANSGDSTSSMTVEKTTVETSTPKVP